VRTIITLALFLVVGFVGSRGFVKRATHRLPLANLFATGMEFFLLGILLGPGGLGLVTSRVLFDLEPIIYLTMGWIGLLFGIDLSWDHVSKISRSVFRFLLVDSIAFILVFSAASYFVIGWAWPGLSPRELAVGALLFGITASVGSPTVIALVAQRLPARGSVTSTMKVAGALSSLFPLVAFGLLFMVVHPEGIGHGALYWLFINAVGLVTGFLMVLFTWERSSDDEMLLLIVGTVLLIGGVCYYLEVSSLYTAMVMGFVVGNFSRKREQIFRELHRIEKPLFLGFLMFIGASVRVNDTVPLVIVTVAYILLRLAMRHAVTGAAVVASFPDLKEHGRKTGLVLAGQGVMAMAIALDCWLASRNSMLTDVLASTLTVIAIAVFVNDLVGFALTRRVLEVVGEVRSPRRGKS
jgi:hypothetical protein